MIMISYARSDQPAVLRLVDDLELAREEVWLDRELAGGQVWWEAILDVVRKCDVLLVVLSPSFLNSRACKAELDYGARLGKVVLAVKVEDVAVQLAPPVIANAQIIDYRSRSVEAAIALVSAIKDLPPSPPLPAPPPDPPKPPISYMSTFSDQVDADTLTYRDQIHLVADLKAYLDRSSDHAVAAELLRRLRNRPDITEAVGRTIDEVLGALTPESPDQKPAPPFDHPDSHTVTGNIGEPSTASPGTASEGHQPGRRRALIAVAAAGAVVVAGITVAALALGGGTGSQTEGAGLPVSDPLKPTQLVVPMETGNDNWALFLADEASPSPGKQLTSGTDFVVGPVLSPDRRTLMYVSATKRDAVSRSLRVAGAADLEGDRPAFPLPPGCDRAVRPAWNPVDTSMIALQCISEDEKQVLRLMTTSGAIIHEVDPPNGMLRMGDPAFTADGKRLAFWAAPADGPGGGGTLYTVSTKGGSPRTLLDKPDKGARYMDPVFSPDGKYVAFVRRPASSALGEHAQILRSRADGSEIIPLTDTRFDHTDPTWSQSGAELAYTSNAPTDDVSGATIDRIWTMTVKGKQEKVLWTGGTIENQAAAAWTAR